MRSLILISTLLIALLSLGQEDEGRFHARGVFVKYDKSFVSPDYKGKHSVSLGLQTCFSSPFSQINFDTIQNYFGFHLGYNYFIMKGKTRILSAKKKKRDEIKIGFGIHTSFYRNGEWFITGNIYRPLIALKGTMLSLFVFNEFGIGLHRSVYNFNDDRSQVAPTLTLEILRIRFGRSTALFGGMRYATRNEFFSKDPKELSLIFGLRYYIYKRKK